MSDSDILRDTYSVFVENQKKLLSLAIGRVALFLLTSSVLAAAAISVGQPLPTLISVGFVALLGVYCVSKIAVPLHRLFLLPSSGENRPAMRRVRTREILQYAGAMTSVGAVMGAIMFVFALGAVSLLVGSGSNSATVNIPVGFYGVGALVVLLVGYVGFRISPLLPAAAVDVRLTMSEAWNTTHDMSGTFIKALVGIGGTALLIGAAFGAGAFYALEAASLGQGLALVAGGFVALQAAFWTATLLSLVFMSVMYDKVIEERLVDDRMREFQVI
ncbi:hypothetical protein CLV74_103212 [Donghicola tyrosinivorans]|uniref:Uncharacterized protein n=2 Tax=Donghicola tyrosinivorans TaxID=1652492 RepID=A0A2T0WY76_9RHOB|nr:hypothetical protein CLV74_103212 [Donghicola tyrosinivorans]